MEDNSESPGPSENLPGTSEPEKYNSDESENSQEVKEEDMESAEECSVCRNTMIDTTTLSDCVHSFCYDCIIGWLTKGSGLFCPMCKSPVNYVIRKDTAEKISVQQIQSQKEPEATASEDLITEKRIVSRKIRGCRRLMNRIDEIIGSRSRTTNEQRIASLNRMKQLCVVQLNSLQMLRDDIDHGAAKAFIVSKVAFRRLVYEKQTVYKEFLPGKVTLTKLEFLQKIEHFRSVLKSFLNVELKALPAKTQPNVDSRENGWYFDTFHDVSEEEEEEIFDRLLNLLAERGLKDISTQETNDTVFRGLVSCRVVMVFLSELRSLLDSRKTFLEWCGSVKYRINSDIGGEHMDNEVVTVDDSIEVDQPSHRTRTLRSRIFPVFTPFEELFDIPSSSRNVGFRRTSSSDTDQDEDIYFQAPLRIGPSAFNPYRPPPPPAALPTAGPSWTELTTQPSSSSQPSKIPVVNLDDDESVSPKTFTSGEERDDNDEESDDDDIQVVDDTIVLDDTRPGPSTPKKSTRKRKSSPRSSETFKLHLKKPKLENLPQGLVDDVQELIRKHNIPTTEVLNVMVAASQAALLNCASLPSENGQSSSSPPLIPPVLFHQSSSAPRPINLSDYLSRYGIGAWSSNAPTKPTTEETGDSQ